MLKNITDITSTELLNSRGTLTIKVMVHVDKTTGTFALPSGASTGSSEAHVKDPHEATRIIREVVKPALVGFDVTDQKGIDARLHELDGTELFETIGGNVALGVSVASCKVAAKLQGKEVWKYLSSLVDFSSQARSPRLFVNLINGGKHAHTGSPIQEHQIIPETDDVEIAYNAACIVQKALKDILVKRYGEDGVGLGDEGGFVVLTSSVFEPFALLEEAIVNANCSIPIAIGADIAASSFFENGTYALEGSLATRDELHRFYRELHARVPLLSMVEDPFDESDLAAFALYKKEHPQVLVIGDDLTTTNVRLLQNAIDATAISGIIIKPNQIGTLSDTWATMKLAYDSGIQCIVSHRSGETEDDFIADLAYGTGSYGLKAGAPLAKEREAKYQRLITISHSRHD